MNLPARLSGRVIDRHLLILGLAFAAGAILRIVGAGRQGFWTDELYVVWEGRQPLDVLLNPQLHIQHPPGYRFVLHAWMGISIDENWIRLVPLVAGILLVPVVWALAHALWPEKPAAASTAAILIATSPYMLHYSQDVTNYSWTTLCVTLSFLLLVLAWRKDRLWLWVAWAVSLAVSLYSHYFALFPLMVEGIGVLVIGLRGGTVTRPRLRCAMLAIAGAALLYVPWVWQLLSSGGDALGIVVFPLTLDLQPLHWMPVLTVGYGHRLVWQYGWGEWLAGFALVALAAWGAWRLYSRRDLRRSRGFLLVVGWMVAAIAGPYLFLRITTPPGSVDPVRFATMAVPALLIAIAAIVASIQPVWRLALLGVWLLLSGWQWRSELVSPPVQDWRGVFATVRQRALPGDVVLAFPAFHAGAAAAYYNEPAPVVGGWFAGEGTDSTGAAYWFPVDWQWRGFLDPVARRSTDWATEIQARTRTATQVWYLAGDGADGTYPPSASAERGLKSLGWQWAEEWDVSPLVLRLYTRADSGPSE